MVKVNSYRKDSVSTSKDVADKYFSIFKNTSDGICIHDINGKILEVNDAYCSMSGYTCEELIGMPVRKFEANENPIEIASHIKKLIKSGGHDRFESKHRRKDGTIFDVNITHLYLDREGGLIASFSEISQSKKSWKNYCRRNQINLRSFLIPVPR